MSDLREKLAQLIANTKAHIRADGRTAYVPIGDAYDAADSVIALLQTEQPNSATTPDALGFELAQLAEAIIGSPRGTDGEKFVKLRDAFRERLRRTSQSNSAPSREEIAAAIALTFGITKFHKDETPMVYKAADAVLALREKAPEQALRVPTESQLRAALEAYSDHSAYVSTVALFAAVEAAFRAE